MGVHAAGDESGVQVPWWSCLSFWFALAGTGTVRAGGRTGQGRACCSRLLLGHFHQLAVPGVSRPVDGSLRRQQVSASRYQSQAGRENALIQHPCRYRAPTRRLADPSGNRHYARLPPGASVVHLRPPAPCLAPEASALWPHGGPHHVPRRPSSVGASADRGREVVRRLRPMRQGRSFRPGRGGQHKTRAGGEPRFLRVATEHPRPGADTTARNRHYSTPRLPSSPRSGVGRIVDRMAKTLRCRIGWHTWRRAQSEDGQLFQECAGCGHLKNPVACRGHHPGGLMAL